MTAVLALAATGLIYLYLRSAGNDAGASTTLSVVVATEDIPSNTDLTPLVGGAVFTTVEVPPDTVVQGAITDVSQLRGQRTAYPIVAGEQIVVGRLQGDLQLAGGALGIPKGYQAMSLTLEPQRIVGGQLQEGDHVGVFGTFQDTSKGGQEQRSLTLVPDAEVLSVLVGETNTAQPGATTVTIALLPRDVTRVILGQEGQKVYLTLLPPNEPGKKAPAASSGSLR
jgi:pilus assembly protein CpaB